MNKEQFEQLIQEKLDNGSSYESLANTLNNQGRPPISTEFEDVCYGLVLMMQNNLYIDDIVYLDENTIELPTKIKKVSQAEAFKKVSTIIPNAKPNPNKYQEWLSRNGLNNPESIAQYLNIAYQNNI